MRSAANVILQPGRKPLSANLSIESGNGRRKGPLGAKGWRESTATRMQDWAFAPGGREVPLAWHGRHRRLRQAQCACAADRVLATVRGGRAALWPSEPVSA